MARVTDSGTATPAMQCTHEISADERNVADQLGELLDRANEGEFLVQVLPKTAMARERDSQAAAKPGSGGPLGYERNQDRSDE